MDTFQKMAEAATELQERWIPEPGDAYYVKNDLYVNNDNKLTTIKQEQQAPYYSKGVHYVGDEGWEFDEETLDLHSFFLPSQKYVQGKLLKRLFKTQEKLFAEFFPFCMKPFVDRRQYTFDELWLMMYQYYIHNLMWDGNDWTEVIERDRWIGG